MRSLAVIILATFFAAPLHAKCVVLLHGLARTSNSMETMARALERDGYQVVNRAYASRSAPIAELAGSAIDPAIAACGSEPVDFVTHSMGGILLRVWARENGPDAIGRAVMLGPPNQGSEIVDTFGDLTLFEILNGPAGEELGTGNEATPNRLGKVEFALGVIAGNRSVSPVYSNLIDGPDDGKVSVESTKVEGMAAHIILPTTHTFMMFDPEVIAATRDFLAFGAFRDAY